MKRKSPISSYAARRAAGLLAGVKIDQPWARLESAPQHIRDAYEVVKLEREKRGSLTAPHLTTGEKTAGDFDE